MKHKTRMIIIAIIIAAAALIAYRAEAAIIAQPIPMSNCALCAPSVKVAPKAPMPVVESKTLQIQENLVGFDPKPTKTVEVDRAEIEKLLKQIIELQKILVALLAQRN